MHEGGVVNTTGKRNAECLVDYMFAMFAGSLYWGMASLMFGKNLLDHGLLEVGWSQTVAVWTWMLIHFPAALVFATASQPREIIALFAAINGMIWGIVIMVIYRRIQSR